MPANNANVEVTQVTDKHSGQRLNWKYGDPETNILLAISGSSGCYITKQYTDIKLSAFQFSTNKCVSKDFPDDWKSLVIYGCRWQTEVDQHSF